MDGARPLHRPRHGARPDRRDPRRRQPYGILPTSAFARWRPSAVARQRRRRRRSRRLIRSRPRCSRRSCGFDQAWTALVPGLPARRAGRRRRAPARRPRSAADVGGVLPARRLQLRLPAEPRVVRLGGARLRRRAEPADRGEGRARVLLEQLGYAAAALRTARAKPLPLLLQLIWRHYQTALDPLQFIDGQPLSETAQIKPYDAAGTKTLSSTGSLDERRRTRPRSRRRTSADAPRPASLLYLMLYFSLVDGGGARPSRLADDEQRQADELVRSRKFLNVGAQPLRPSGRSSARRRTASSRPKRPANRCSSFVQRSAARGIRGTKRARAARRARRPSRDAHGATRARACRAHRHAQLPARRVANVALCAAAGATAPDWMRRPDERRTGIYLGAYGYLENVHPAPGTRQKIADASLPEQLRQGTDELYSELDQRRLRPRAVAEPRDGRRPAAQRLPHARDARPARHARREPVVGPGPTGADAARGHPQRPVARGAARRAVRARAARLDDAARRSR